MILNRCRICGCPTDPAETVCDDCKIDMEAAEHEAGAVGKDVQQGKEGTHEFQEKN